MRVMLRRLLLIIFLMSVSFSVFAERIFVRATPLKVTETDWTLDCGNGCVPWEVWHVYKIRINEVIKGDLKEKKLNVALLMHASYDLKAIEQKNNWYLVIEPFSKDEFPDDSFFKKYAVRYKVVTESFPLEFVCFGIELGTLLDEDIMFDTPYISKGKRYCYSQFRNWGPSQ